MTTMADGGSLAQDPSVGLGDAPAPLTAILSSRYSPATIRRIPIGQRISSSVRNAASRSSSSPSERESRKATSPRSKRDGNAIPESRHSGSWRKPSACR
jgi:hypothetical protein